MFWISECKGRWGRPYSVCARQQFATQGLADTVEVRTVYDSTGEDPKWKQIFWENQIDFADYPGHPGTCLTKSQENNLEVSMLHRLHTHHYIVCYYINIAERTMYINHAAGTSNARQTFRNIFSIYSEKYCTLSWQGITNLRIMVGNNKGNIHLAHFNSLQNQNQTRLPP